MQELFVDIEQLLSCFKKYMNHLDNTTNRMEELHHSPEPARLPSENSFICVCEASITSTPYLEVFNALGDNYEPLHLNNFTPDERFERRRWINNISLSVPFVLCSYQHGHYKGTEHFLWKISSSPAVRNDSSNAQVIASITNNIGLYATRTMKKMFVDKYSQRVKVPKMVLRHMFRELSIDCRVAETSEQQSIDDRTAEFFHSSGDPSLLLDLRVLNGRVVSTHFDAFWSEVDKFVDKAVVQECRHGDHLFLPIAMSIEDFHTSIVNWLPDGKPTPSAEWIRLQFWPKNPYLKVSSH
uniref:Uncharacterized protein n=1 Tax=Amphimedon queenslandica TaxID=400682 RepID=A0A1X7VJH9_AMPQE